MRSQVVSVDAPIEGWNAFDSLDNMPPNSAIVLDNLIPSTGKVVTRPGHLVYADLGTGSPVETVVAFNSSSTAKLIAASAGGIWDITDGTTPVEVAAAGTYTNDRWTEQNYRKADESGVLILCNGEDNTQVYNGTTLSDLVDTDTVGVDFIGGTAFKGRMYYWKDDDDGFYYTDAGAYQGTLSRYPLGAFISKGGKLVMVSTWTQQDSGDGKDDFIVFVFSTGEILIYQGDDPGGVGFFEMVGRYSTAEPLSRRGAAKYGSDLIIMTYDGYVSLSSIVQQGRTSDVPQFSRLIHNEIVQNTEIRGEFYGWDVVLYERAGLMVFNVPLSDVSFEQHVMNTVTQRWCRFKNMNVNCFNTFKGKMYGGASNGTVVTMLQGTADLGEAIEFTALYAFNYLGDAGNNKHLTAAQVLTTHSQPEYINILGFADWVIPSIPRVQLPPGTSAGAWSPAKGSPQGSFWDEDYWAVSTSPVTYKGWQNVSAYGYAVSLLVRFAKLNEPVVWRSTGIRFNSAGAQ